MYLDSEKSDKFKASTPDGKIEKFAMDVKTIGKTGKYTIKSTLEKASRQGACAVVLMQGTRRMTRQYVESQLVLFRQMSPQKARDKMEYVIVVGTSGNEVSNPLTDANAVRKWITLQERDDRRDGVYERDSYYIYPRSERD